MITRFLTKYLPVLVILLTTLLFFYPVIFAEKTFFFRDFHRFFYPLKIFLATAFKNGFIPFWNPQIFCGSPFASFVLNAVFYPLSIVFLLLPFPLSLNVFVIVHFILGFCFFYFFITSLGLSRKAAVFTSISYCYGSYTISTITVINHLPTLIWMPAIFWSFHEAITKKNVTHFFLTTAFLCMALLGGAPQLLLITVGMLSLCTLTWLPPGETGWRPRLKNLCIVPLLLTLSIAITAVQQGPMYIDYQNSIRLEGISYAEATEFSLQPAMLKHLLVPLTFPPDFITNPASLSEFFPGDGRIPWLLTIYPGFLILPLALFGTCFRFSKTKALWLVLFLFGILLALGHNTPFYRFFFALFPSFRFPEKFMSMASIGLLVMAAYGVHHLLFLCRKKAVPINRLFFFLLVALTLDLYLANRNLNPVVDTAFYRFHHQDLETVIADSGRHRIYIDPDIPSSPGPHKSIQSTHIQWQNFLTPNLGTLWQLSHVGGATGMELVHQYLITELLGKPWPQKIDFLRLANVKYIVSFQRLDKIPHLSGKLDQINPYVYRIKDPLPRAWLVGELLPGKDNIIEALSGPVFDMKQSAVTRNPISTKFKAPAFKPVGNMVYRDNAIYIDAKTSEPAVLVLSESFYPGWEVRVDGVKKECLRLNYLFQGVALEKGRHQIVFKYRPPHFTLFLTISICSLALLLCVWAGLVLRRTDRA